MRIFIGIALCVLLGFSRARAFTNLGNGTFQSDGSASDTQAAINASVSGSTVLIPAGTFTWSGGVTVAKPLILKGAGAGGFLANSASSVAIGTGARTFTTQTNLALNVGQAIIAYVTYAGATENMVGTVNSYAGTTLVLNVTATTGSGTYRMWTFCAPPTTTIIDNSPSAPVINITPASGTINISGIYIIQSGTQGPQADCIDVRYAANSSPVLIHDCRFTANGARGIEMEMNSGVIWNCSFDCGLSTAGGLGIGNGGASQGISFKCLAQTMSWSNNSTMGTADLGGTNNVYVENCYFAGLLQSEDCDDNSRTVTRFCTFDQAACVSHGWETSPWGNRHWEYYNNNFVFTDVGGTNDYNMANGWFLMRGGTGVMMSNQFAVISGQWWGNKGVFAFAVENLTRANMNNACFATYPVPHQLGQGYISGQTTSSNGFRFCAEPFYIWGNSVNQTNYWWSDITPDECGHGLHSSDWVVLNRDFFVGTAKPGYTPYVYPHPLRTAASGGTGNQPPVAIVSATPTNGVAPLTVNFSSAGSSDPEGTVLAYNWTFGDGGNSTAANPSHVYQTNGSYQARLAVSDGTNSTISGSLQIVVGSLTTNQPPVAVASASPTNGVMPLTVTFSSAGSSDPEGAALTYNWTFGDGGTSTIANPVHTYTTAGVYGARLTVSDGTNAIASSNLSVTVSSTSGAIYYVDSVIGSDTNSGTNPSAPWKNCPGMTAYSGSVSLNPGDKVFFAQGRTWIVTGPQGIYLTGGVTYVGNAWGTGSVAIVRAGSDCDSGVVRFRDDPVHETVFQGFEVDANHTISTGVDINHSHWSLMNGATKRVKDCLVHDTWSRTSLGQYKYGIIISNFGGTNGYCENVEILNTVVHDISRDGVCLYPGDVDSGCRIKNITVRGCEVYDTGQDPDYGAGAGFIVKGYVQDAWVDHCYSHDTKGAAMFINGNENNHYPGIGPTNINICYSIFTCTNANGAIRIYDGSSGKDPKTINVYGNLVYNSTVTGGLYVDTDLGNTNSLRIYNNSFYNAPIYINAPSATFSVLEFKNNIVQYAGGIPLTDGARQITAHSNNIIYGIGTLVVSGGNSYNASNLKLNFEPSSSSADPLFKNPSSSPTAFIGSYGVDMRPNNDGLSLRQGSYGIDHGATMGAPFAGSVNSIARPSGAGWDIGAYETAASMPAPPTNLRIVSQ